MTLTAFHCLQALLGHFICGVRICGYSADVVAVVVEEEGGGAEKDGVEEDWEEEGEEGTETVSVVMLVVVVVALAGGALEVLLLLGLVVVVSLGLVAFEPAAVVVVVVVVVVLFLGLKPGKALPCTSWPARTMGGSLAQYCAFGSGGGREFSPIRGCLRRGREQLLQTSRSEVGLGSVEVWWWSFWPWVARSALADAS